ncbi:SpoIIE family protein phosphatase [Kovacikia minuta CCNUW1]|nr:SpoIIE family protein phosphatase [Kovacikia minuta CCNUW1]
MAQLQREIQEREQGEAERQQTEAALQASEAELRSFFAAMPDVTLVIDGDGRMLKVLAPTNDHFFVAPSISQIGKTLHEVLPTVQADLELRFIRQCLETQQVITDIEYSLPIGDRELWFTATVSPLSENTVIWVARDITDRKRAEASLQASEAELRALFAAMNDIVAVFDHQGTCLRIAAIDPNDLFIPSTEQIGRTVHENLPKTAADIHLESIQHALKTQQTVSIEYSLMMEEQESWFSAKVSPLSESTVIMVSREITDLKRAAKTVRDSEAELRSLFAAMSDITMVFNGEGRVLKILAPILEERFFLPPQEQIGGTIDEQLPPAEAALQLKFIRQCLETQQVITNIEYCLPIGNQETWFSANVSPLPDNRVLWIARDISDRKQAEASLQEGLHLLALANQEIVSLNQQLESENLRMSAELSVTRQLQQMILPREDELSQVEGLEISGFMEPAAEVGGDYYDVQTHNGLVKIGIGDVMGHGLESGMLMLMVQTAVKTLLINQETNSTQLLNTLNQVIYENARRMNSDKNITLVLLDYDQGQIRVSGQHEQVIVVRADGKIEQIDTDDLGFPLGLVADISAFVTQTQIQLDSGDGVVLYTDGITEAENSTRDLYGLERLCEIVSQNWQKSVHEIRQALVDDVYRHIGDQKIYDDITLLVLKQK